MHFNPLIHLTMLLPALFDTGHGDYGYLLILCRELGSLQNVELIYSVNYNMVELLRYNSTENKAVGYTEYAIKWAEDINKNPVWLKTEAEKNIADCRHFGETYLPLIETTVKPEVMIRSVRQVSGNQPAMLICSAYDFYPKPIKIFWSRDGEELTSDVTSTEELADGDWYYQIHSHLEYFPKPGEKISCVVQHASFTKPMIYDWDSSLSSLSDFERHQIIVGSVGLILGMILTTAALIYYKRRCTARDMTPTSSDRFLQSLQTMN